MSEYPKMMHKGGAEKTVHSAEEEKALGAGWISGHEHWAKLVAANPDTPVPEKKKRAGKKEKKVKEAKAKHAQAGHLEAELGGASE